MNNFLPIEQDQKKLTKDKLHIISLCVFSVLLLGLFIYSIGHAEGMRESLEYCISTAVNK